MAKQFPMPAGVHLMSAGSCSVVKTSRMCTGIRPMILPCLMSIGTRPVVEPFPMSAGIHPVIPQLPAEDRPVFLLLQISASNGPVSKLFPMPTGTCPAFMHHPKPTDNSSRFQPNHMRSDAHPAFRPVTVSTGIHSMSKPIPKLSAPALMLASGHHPIRDPADKRRPADPSLKMQDPASSEAAPLPKPEEPPPEDISMRHRASEIRPRYMHRPFSVPSQSREDVHHVSYDPVNARNELCATLLLKLYVWNRIAVIQERIGRYRWEYVRSLQHNIEPPEDVPDQMLPQRTQVIVTSVDLAIWMKNQHLIIPKLRHANEIIIHGVQLVHLADKTQPVAHDPCKKLTNQLPIYTDGDVVPDLSTGAFLAPLDDALNDKEQLPSDNATSFRGAYHELNTLQSSKKNLQTSPSIRENVVVLFHDRKQQPSLNWKLGCTTAVHPGDDGSLRIVDVRLGSSSSRRPIKFSVLPTHQRQRA